MRKRDVVQDYARFLLRKQNTDLANCEMFYHDYEHLHASLGMSMRGSHVP